MPLEGQFLCYASSLSVLAIALYKNFPQNVVLMGHVCMYVLTVVRSGISDINPDSDAF